MKTSKPGKQGCGRPPEPGNVYRFELYYRFIPGQDPPELAELLDSIIRAKGRKRRDILRAALLGGIQPGQDVAAKNEDSETADILNDMLGNFLA